MKKHLELFKIKPLSFIKYFNNNMKRSLVIMVALILSIFMIIIFQMVIYSVTEAGRLGDVGVSDYVTKVFPKAEGRIDESVVKDMQSNPEVEKIMLMNQQDMDYNHFFGACNIGVFSVRDVNVKYVLDKLGLKLKEGRMPIAGKNEILLDWRLVNNKNKKLGDYIGKELNQQEKLPGKYKIVGTLEGKCIIGLIPLEENKALSLNSLFIFPKYGQLKEINQEIKKVSLDKATFWSKEKADNNYNVTQKSINNLFGIMSMAIIFVMSFASGNSSYAQYFSRRHEFGILQSIGYTRGEILLRTAKEMALLNLIGLAGGIILGLITGLILDQVFFIPHGYPFILIQPDGLIEVFTIPLCTALFGLIPVGWLLSKIDPMTVIEKNE